MTDTHIAPQLWAPAARDSAAAEVIAAPSLTFWQDVRKRLWANKPAMLGLHAAMRVKRGGGGDQGKCGKAGAQKVKFHERHPSG